MNFIKLKALFIFALAICLQFGCKNNEQSTPENTVSNYLEAIDKFGFDAAKKLTIENENTINTLENIKKFSGKFDEAQKSKYISERKTYNIIVKSKSDGKAIVAATNNQGMFISSTLFELVNKNGIWLIGNIKSEE